MKTNKKKISKSSSSKRQNKLSPLPVSPHAMLEDWITNYIDDVELGVRAYNHPALTKKVPPIEIMRELVRFMTGGMVVQTILSLAYPWTSDEQDHVCNPYQVLPALEHESGLLISKIVEYLRKVSPKKWSIPLLELIAHMEEDEDLISSFQESNKDSRTMESLFKQFVAGPVSSNFHSREFYDFTFRLFFTGEPFSVIARAVDDYFGHNFEGTVPLMRSMIMQGKKNLFLMDFEIGLSMPSD